MIVKDEEHVIEKTLTNICSYISFDYWVISDTGSTDKTKQIIRNFFKNKNIPGTLIEQPWRDFGYNRTKALEGAYNKTDYVMVWDADDTMHGDFKLPLSLEADCYYVTFSNSSSSFSYTRAQFFNNRKKWKYVGVLHEYPTCLDNVGPNVTITGNYYFESARDGARNKDAKKYEKDAIILEKAYKEAVENKDPLMNRYVYYCAQSYRDAGYPDKAIEYYIKTLSHEGWIQERYTSCINIHSLYEKKGKQEIGLSYLVESYNHDKTRIEGIYGLIKYYCIKGMNEIAYMYYSLIQENYESSYKNFKLRYTNYLFASPLDYEFYLPYYMIIVCDRLNKRETGLKMYEIVFHSKAENVGEWWLNNFIFNLKFFIPSVDPKNKKFFENLEDYLNFLYLQKYNANVDRLHEFVNFGLNPNNVLALSSKKKDKEKKDTVEQPKHSVINENKKKILIYTGFSYDAWNETYSKKNYLGGSERAVIHMANYLSKNHYTDFDIYIGGAVLEETIGNVTYVNLDNLPKLVRECKFEAIIISRYVSFFEMFSYFKTDNVIIWAHDTYLLPYGTHMTQEEIIKKWQHKINKCVCLTEWHRDEYLRQYPEFKDKIEIIGNGIIPELFPSSSPHALTFKTKNRFVYSSAEERGLERLLELWPEITKSLPNAELKIAGKKGTNEKIKEFIYNYSNVEHLGPLKPEELYRLMDTCEYWLYPTNWNETYCITALEMLCSQVICLYYPVAGLVNTMDTYGIQVSDGNEVDTIVRLTEETKQDMKRKGKEYALNCSWENRAKEMCMFIRPYFSKKKKNSETLEDTPPLFENKDKNVLGKAKETVLFFLPFWYNVLNLQDYFDSYKSKYNLIYTIDENEAISVENASKLLFVYEVSSEKVYNYFFNKVKENKNTTLEISIFNTEPMNLIHRYKNLEMSLNKYEGIKVYDYSLSNIRILNANGFTNTHHLPYLIYKEEQEYLVALKENTDQIYDFGIISHENPVIVLRRVAVVNYLLQNGYTVKVIQGFKNLRDEQIAQCRVLLNIHGSNNGENSNIFEHIRCDRLLAAGFHILSEDSHNLCSNFTNKYADNLKIIDYNDFFKVETYLNLTSRKKIIDCFI